MQGGPLKPLTQRACATVSTRHEPRQARRWRFRLSPTLVDAPTERPKRTGPPNAGSPPPHVPAPGSARYHGRGQASLAFAAPSRASRHLRGDERAFAGTKQDRPAATTLFAPSSPTTPVISQTLGADTHKTPSSADNQDTPTARVARQGPHADRRVMANARLTYTGERRARSDPHRHAGPRRAAAKLVRAITPPCPPPTHLPPAMGLRSEVVAAQLWPVLRERQSGCCGRGNRSMAGLAASDAVGDVDVGSSQPRVRFGWQRDFAVQRLEVVSDGERRDAEGASDVAGALAECGFGGDITLAAGQSICVGEHVAHDERRGTADDDSDRV